MSTLSVAIATFNEGENIERCLDSIQDWVNEIVIVDGNSNDETLEKVKKYNVHLIHGKNEPMFHKNKQKAIDACKGNWILQLDADEVISKELKEEIISIISHQPSAVSHQLNGFWMPRRNYFMGKFLSKGGQYPDYTLRLYRQGKGKLPCESVHEQAEVKGRTGYLKNPLLHYSYPNFSHYLAHFNLYTDIFAQELRDKRAPLSIVNTILYMVIKPNIWFFMTFIRHKGFMDGFAGFVFSLFSALRFPAAYSKYWEMMHGRKNRD